jgi:oxygen-independent coproporphyrinogen-3 oxidase
MTRVSSLYVHVPFCQHLCNYCDFYKQKLDDSVSQIEKFHQFLSASVRRHEALLAEAGFGWAPLETVYLGGGTPSLWGPAGATFFRDRLLPAPLAPGAEFTMEVDPGTWTPELLEAWRAAGLNRISVGTQSLDAEFLKILDRAHGLPESLALLAELRRGDWNFSLDFLLGVPFSQRGRGRDIRAELERLLEFSPNHISLYILNARSKYPHAADLPDDDYVRDEYLFVSDYLRSLGFHHYEVSNFARPGYEARHNLRYWRGESVGALGPTATGYLATAEKALRYKWKVSRAEVEVENLSAEERALEETYLSLRTSDGLNFKNDDSSVINDWEGQGYAYREAGKVKLTSKGFVMLDSLMDDLFRSEFEQKRAKRL